MRYDEMDLQTRERAAWQRGDYVLAEACAKAIDAEAEAQEALSAADEEFTREQAAREDAEAELRRVKDEMLERLTALEWELNAAKRMGNRDSIMAAFAACEAVLA